MTLWTSDAIAAATAGRPTAPFQASGVSIDTRTLRPGDLFVALQAATDGHAHIPGALVRGAAGVLAVNAPPGAPAILVDDTLKALTALGAAARARFRGTLIAITGSVGKTTTKEMLRTALSAFGPTHAAEASYNNHWGVPLTLARIPADAQFCVAEIGMNNPGEILPLARLARPDVAVITTIGSAHIGHLGSLGAIAREKSDLLRALPPSGTAIIPAGPFEPTLHAAAPGPVLAIGTDIRALATRPDAQGTDIDALVAGHPLAFRLPVPGPHMVHDALCTLAAVHALGLDPARAAQALSTFTPAPGRGTQRRLGDILLLDESYNASVASVRAALSVLRLIPAPRRLAVLGDMLELGAHARAEHDSLAPDIEASADLLYACGPHTSTLFDRLPPAHRGAHAENAARLAPIVAAAARPGDAILVKGSLGSRMRLVVQALEAAHPAGAPA